MKLVVCCIILSLLVLIANCEDKLDVDSLSPDTDTSGASPKKSVRCRICTHYTQCSSAPTDGSNLLDPRKTSQDTEVPLNGKLTPANCRFPYVCCDSQTGPGGPYKHKCGIRNANGVDARIISKGQDGSTEFGEFPWQGAILRKDGQNRVFVSACVLINKNYAVTAAHPLVPYRRQLRSLLAEFGVWDSRSENSEPLPSQSVSISGIFFHSDFNSQNLRHDIAILKFASPITYTPNVDTICLPFSDEEFSGQNCIATGWGKDTWEGGSYSPVLRKVNLKIRTNKHCEEMLRKTRLGPNYQLHRCFVCAGGVKDQDVCKGDGGGPLVCYRRAGTYSLAGITSWGIGCGQDNVPGVYVRTSCYLDWISNITRLPLSTFRPADLEPED